MENTYNRFIKASAGTGKTYTIVNNVAKMVTVDSIPLKEILIVTYTEKAVGELKERIRKALGKKGKPTDEAQIYTIHSFCQRVLEDYAILAGQPSEKDLVDDKELGLCVDRWIRDSLKTNGIDFFKKRKDVNKTIRDLKRDFTQILRTYDKSDILESKDKWISKKDDKGNEKDDIDYLNVLYDNIDSLVDYWNREKEDRKVQTYNDMIRFVRDKVTEENSKLTEELRRVYRCGIIDEFQDTNGYQWDIFQSIFLDANDNMHSLFVVGDKKQSIYGFQGADLEVYSNAEQYYINRKLTKTLYDNWRSSEEMIQACNDLFKGDFFNGTVFDESKFPSGNKHNQPIKLCGMEISPLWFYSKTNQDYDSFCDEYEFAAFVVKRIMFCCSKSPGKNETNLRIPKLREKNAADLDDYAKDPNNWDYQDVNYSDFAILASKSSEMVAFESELRKKHIPYTRYKDKNLFNSMECQHWISLLNAIDADDFTGKNKSILTEALFTKFFSEDKEKLVSSIDSPSDPLRQCILKWHDLAEKRMWANLIESIFEESGIEERLSSEKKYLSISRFRQIGMTILEMLYENAITIADVIHDLTSKMRQLPDEGDLVEKGTDRKAVQIMTIHAAKGLEFPVVIPVAGFKGRFKQIPHVYSYYEKGSKILSFSNYGKKEYWKSYQEELKRLYYVAYTRAQYLMIIPRYPAPKSDWEDTEFIRNAIKHYIEKHKDENNFGRAEGLFDDWKEETPQTETGPQESPVSTDLESIPNTKALLTSKHSYSSLSNKKEKNEDEKDPLTISNTDSEKGSEGENGDPESTESTTTKVDPSQINPNPLSDKYPKGSKAGNAVHTIFELANFQDYGGKVDEKELSEDEEFKKLVHDSFWTESYNIDEEDSLKIRIQTASYVWNTLNAKLPMSIGSKTIDGGYFRLKEIKQEDKLAEIEFHIDSETDDDVLRHYCMGFIDLLFKHEVNGKQVFSILDWKTDTKLDGEQINYSDANEVKHVIDSEYSIQRTLYSYCLIKWLLQFHKYGDTPQKVFDNYFGGIYYVLIRGCKADTDIAIYRHPWKSWEDLESKYRELIKSQMH